MATPENKPAENAAAITDIPDAKAFSQAGAVAQEVLGTFVITEGALLSSKSMLLSLAVTIAGTALVTDGIIEYSNLEQKNDSIVKANLALRHAEKDLNTAVQNLDGNHALNVKAVNIIIGHMQAFVDKKAQKGNHDQLWAKSLITTMIKTLTQDVKSGVFPGIAEPQQINPQVQNENSALEQTPQPEIEM